MKDSNNMIDLFGFRNLNENFENFPGVNREAVGILKKENS